MANQTEKEFFALVDTGRKGVETMFATMGSELQRIAAPNVSRAFDTWSQRALVEISGREELAPVISTKTGILSVYKCLGKAATMGLQIGGQYAHAYIVPMGAGKATLVPTADGLAFASAHGPGAVLRNVPELVRVYEKDDFALDKAAGSVRHNPQPFGDRGKLAGYYMRLEYLDGHVEIPTITHDEVLDVVAKYGNLNGPAYKKSLQAMHDKTAAKQLLKKPAKEAEGLAMLMSLDEYEHPQQSQEPPMRDVTDRTASYLDSAAEALTPAETADPQPELILVADKPKPTTKDTGDIF